MLFLHQRQRALEESKRASFWNFLVSIIALGYFVDLAVNMVVAFIEHGNSYNTSDNSLFFGHHVGIVSIYIVVLYLVFFVIWEQSRAFSITGWEPLTAIPIWYLAVYAVIIYLMIFTLQGGEYSFVGRIFLTFWLLGLAYARRRRSSREKKRAQATSAAKKADDELPATAQKAVKHCEICHEESIYDLCLTCEKKHRTERHRVRAQILRAKQFGVPATLTLAEWLDILKAFNYKCAYCQQNDFTLMEHYLPIPHGGTTADNCVPGCHGCNAKKSNKHPEK